MTDRDAQLTKRVDYVTKDADAQTATGVVMVPNTVDRQGDFERRETIAAFADQFGAFMDVDEADGGVMHAVWPSEWMSLERNEVLNESETIGETTVDAGAWVQTWQYNDDDLWKLVEDGILGGHSIGAVNAEWDYIGEDPSELPDDVTVPDEVDVDEYYELTDGIIQEVSAVDIPAVPEAQILSASKSGATTAEKRLADHLGSRDGFIEEAKERGHSEEDAERLWGVLDRAVSVEGAADPGAKAKLASAMSALVSALPGGSSDERRADAQTAKNATEGDTSDTSGSTTDAADDMGDDTTTDTEPPEWAKELMEQTQENSERIEAAIEEQKSEADGGGDGEKADGDGETDAFADAPEWAKALKAETERNAERINDVATAAGHSQQIDAAAGGRRGDRKYSSAWDDTLGLPNGGDA
ncbi:XkdF-like putative serine protease domain-containing protein [Halobaculum sp. CBA1158]|uniref:XkdF-like putative serine protease domain-containing protein n=1 Tax=Halobaculum sp. CBA1158 TaxID=2904243 RepID=UPI001F2BA460|nr:XkdF-like putative serine protease domain-containing protein [Halobaculum sp. CBA1158]UIP00343.1 XkdF-like putative serine protease domain-containing protein [Halobaculum sp. CBA1158]